jgi:hypothetical protein
MRLIYLGFILALCFTASGCFLKSKIKLPEKNHAEMTIDDIKAHLRKSYGFFECPQKSDRLLITEEIWQQIDWTEEEIYRNAALPHKIWNMRHDDHSWPSCHEWRGDDARGPRAGEGHDKYFPPLPTLVKGRGIARWMARGDVSILEIPLFKDYSVTWTTATIPSTIEVIERKPGHSLYGSTQTITKEHLLSNYAPSPLQKFSDKSYLETYPTHKSYHIMLEKRETYTGKPNGPDSVYFWRYGWRWDSYDDYYVKNAKYIGGRWN